MKVGEGGVWRAGGWEAARVSGGAQEVVVRKGGDRV
jgi:hypothetical protein